MVIDYGHLLLAGIAAFGLIVWYGVRRHRAAARRIDELDKAGRWQCPRCESRALQRLPANAMSKHPGYRCKGCDLRMRPSNTTVLYVVLLATTLGIGVTISVAIFMEPGEAGKELGPRLLDPHFYMIMGAFPVGIVYLILQLSRPTPKLREEPLYEGAGPGR